MLAHRRGPAIVRCNVDLIDGAQSDHRSILDRLGRLEVEGVRLAVFRRVVTAREVDEVAPRITSPREPFFIARDVRPGWVAGRVYWLERKARLKFHSARHQVVVGALNVDQIDDRRPLAAFLGGNSCPEGFRFPP